MTNPPARVQAAPSEGPTYASYLHLDEILGAQAPRSDAHDEMLFIVIHQASELWIKLCLHELDAARRAIREDRLAPALKMMARVSRIQEQLIQSWGVLATITPSDYSRMRAALGTSSGFQSVQHRLVEFMLGKKNPRMIEVHAGAPAARQQLADELARPSLYDEAIALLARRGLPIPEAAWARRFTEPYVASPAVAAAWAEIYRQPQLYWDLYDLAEKLVDIDYRFQLWRFGHLKAIERVIGAKQGTGGSTGVAYLATLVGDVFFPELIEVRKAL